jgi:hypothetical protein
MSLEINHDLSLAINHLVTRGVLFCTEIQDMHRCQLTCADPCERKIRLLGLAAVVLDVCVKTINKLLYPELFNDFDLDILFLEVIRKVWELHNLGEQPWSRLEPERNVEIMATMHAVARGTLEDNLFFLGWRG